jgi:hypothetical protein
MQAIAAAKGVQAGGVRPAVCLLQLLLLQQQQQPFCGVGFVVCRMSFKPQELRCALNLLLQQC